MISEHERLLLIVELIAHDLKICKHFHFLERSGLDTSNLGLNLHDKIFKLAGIDKDDNEEVREWYFQMAENSIEIDVFSDEKKLLEAASEIMIGLDKKTHNRSSFK